MINPHWRLTISKISNKPSSFFISVLSKTGAEITGVFSFAELLLVIMLCVTFHQLLTHYFSVFALNHFGDKRKLLFTCKTLKSRVQKQKQGQNFEKNIFPRTKSLKSECFNLARKLLTSFLNNHCMQMPCQKQEMLKTLADKYIFQENISLKQGCLVYSESLIC